MRIRITVTEEDIARGKRESCTGCPIGRAAKRALGRDFAPEVNPMTLDVLLKGALVAYAWLPKRAQDFIADFDIKVPVKPFSFTVHLPAYTARPAMTHTPA